MPKRKISGKPTTAGVSEARDDRVADLSAFALLPPGDPIEWEAHVTARLPVLLRALDRFIETLDRATLSEPNGDRRLDTFASAICLDSAYQELVRQTITAMPTLAGGYRSGGFPAHVATIWQRISDVLAYPVEKTIEWSRQMDALFPTEAYLGAAGLERIRADIRVRRAKGEWKEQRRWAYGEVVPAAAHTALRSAADALRKLVAELGKAPVMSLSADGVGARSPAPGPEIRSARDEHGSPFVLGHLRRSEDYASVRWGDDVLTFTLNQCAALRCLWKNCAHGTPDVKAATLADAAGVSAEGIRTLFRGHRAWRTLIVSKTKGTYRIDPSARPLVSETVDVPRQSRKEHG